MNTDQMLRENSYNEFIGHTVQQNGRCKCGASEWPHRIELNLNSCFVGAGQHNFAADGICQDCGNRRASPLPRTWAVEQPLDESAFIAICSKVNKIAELISIANRSLFVSLELEAERRGFADAGLSEEYQAVFAGNLREEP